MKAVKVVVETVICVIGYVLLEQFSGLSAPLCALHKTSLGLECCVEKRHSASSSHEVLFGVICIFQTFFMIFITYLSRGFVACSTLISICVLLPWYVAVWCLYSLQATWPKQKKKRLTSLITFLHTAAVAQFTEAHLLGYRLMQLYIHFFFKWVPLMFSKAALYINSLIALRCADSLSKFVQLR